MLDRQPHCRHHSLNSTTWPSPKQHQKSSCPNKTGKPHLLRGTEDSVSWTRLTKCRWTIYVPHFPHSVIKKKKEKTQEIILMISLQHQNSYLALHHTFHNMEGMSWFGISSRQLLQQCYSANITWTLKGDGFRFKRWKTYHTTSWQWKSQEMGHEAETQRQNQTKEI